MIPLSIYQLKVWSDVQGEKNKVEQSPALIPCFGENAYNFFYIESPCLIFS